VRRAIEADARALAELHVRAWQWAYRDRLPEAFLDSLSATVEGREARRRDVLAHPESELRTWVAEVSGEIVGFADTGPSRDDDAASEVAELYAIYVDQKVLATGVGRALMQQATDDLRERGYRTGVLWVLDGNTTAQRFYEAAGWSLDGRVKTENSQGLVLREVRYSTDL
jgi:GNAT superfamily N-acetyltransferase